MSKKKHKKSKFYGLPEVFFERLTHIVGLSYFEQIKKTFVERLTTFRINTLKARDHESIKALLQEHGFKVRQVPWYKDAYVLLNKSKRELTDLNIYTEGKIYIQSLASMTPPLILDPQPGEKVLDLTAAPGSKTSQIAALMEKQGELLANDKNKIRFFKLKHNLEVLGVVEPTPPNSSLEGISGSLLEEGREVLDTWHFALRMEDGYHLCKEYPEYFDKILLDAPCSAEARFVEGDPKTYGYWKEQKIKEMAFTQRGLLFSAWRALKLGGTLVYSTCTFAPEENELQISRFLEKVNNGEIVDIKKILDIKNLPVVKEWKNRPVHPDVVKHGFRIMPTSEIEGFFIVKIHKKLANG